MAAIQEGPDLNGSRSPLDKKLYRQIMLPNGLWAVLISDTLAMHQDIYENDGDDEGDEDVDMKNQDEDETNVESDGNENDADEEGEEDEEEEDDGIRNAAAAMVVGVGSMYDNPEAQGIAHFLEHMVFMGSEKYPGENAYDSFLSKHGGSDNAYTEIEYTVYHLEIPQEELSRALDMFAQFFIAPLMLEGAVDRELNSIESEFQLSKNSDQCRLQQLMCHTCGQTVDSHPFSKFSWGNLQSLREAPKEAGVDLMELLQSFYNQYYFAGNMRLVVMGAYSLDKLQEEVVSWFSDIPAAPREKGPFEIKYDKPGTWDQRLVSPMRDFGLPMKKTSAKVYRIIPVRDRHTLSITWQVPPQMDNWRSKPCDYLAHLLGHEASGSILASLKEKSWATGCFAGIGSEGIEFASSHALFMVTFTLSEEGMNHWEKIVSEVFVYIGLLRHLCDTEQLPEWIHEELRMTNEISYRYRDEQDPVDFVESFADNLAPHYNIPPDRLLDACELLFDYDEGLIKESLGYLSPANLRIDLMSSKYGRESDFSAQGEDSTSADDKEEKGSNGTADNLQCEPRFGARYWCEDVAPETMKEWYEAVTPSLPPPDSLLSLPPKNPFVPEKLDLKPLPPDDGDHPLLNSSLKLCISVGKRKSWFPATVVKYNSVQNHLMLSYEDEDEKWHHIDQKVIDLTPEVLIPGYEGTMDQKTIKFRLVSLAKDGEGAVLKYGDDSDFDVQDGLSFPPVPPAVEESRLPKLIYDEKSMKMWHLQDRKFKRPIAELRLRVICSGANKSPLHRACSDLMVNLCHDAVTETCYLASVCELGSSISDSDMGFTVRVHGFDDKLLDLFKIVFDVLLSFRGRSKEDGLPVTVREGRFEACVEVLQRRYENSGLKASHLSGHVRVRCLRPTGYTAFEKSEALGDVSVEKFTTTMTEVLQTVAIEALYHGNVDSTDAIAAKDVILEILNKSGGSSLSQKAYPTELVLCVPPSINPLLAVCPTKDVTEANTSVEYYFQIGKDNTIDRVLIDLLAHMMEEPFFDSVRTKDQFGYTVGCDARWTCGIIGIYFYVVSSTKSAAEITERIDKFISDFRTELSEMTKETFMEHMVGLAKNKLEMFHSLSDETDNYWAEIRDGRMEWQVKRDEVLTLRAVTHAQILAAFEKWLYPSKANSFKRRSMVVQIIGQSDGKASHGRPLVTGSISAYIDEQARNVVKSVNGDTWGSLFKSVT